MSIEQLTERERRILETAIQTYIETAEPAASQEVARRSSLGISPASVRSTMSDLEGKGYLYHPHTSSGRIPTDRAYRVYVDGLMLATPPTRTEQDALRRELRAEPSAFGDILRRAAQVLSVLTRELGVAASPGFDQAVLQRLDLVPVAGDRILLVLHIRSGLVRTIFVPVPTSVAEESVARVAAILNERLAGITLAEIRSTLAERLRDAHAPLGGTELLNIFLAEGEEIFDLTTPDGDLVLGSARLLADQPEFASQDRIRDLLTLTERRDVLARVLGKRADRGLTITIGGEHADPELSGLTLVTSSYRVGDLTGVIGVLGPTRMPYDKIIGLVETTSRLVEGLLE